MARQPKLTSEQRREQAKRVTQQIDAFLEEERLRAVAKARPPEERH